MMISRLTKTGDFEIVAIVRCATGDLFSPVQISKGPLPQAGFFHFRSTMPADDRVPDLIRADLLTRAG
jgi:hypothetical protein